MKEKGEKNNGNFWHVRILLASPLPPPVGGIGTWTKIVLEEMKERPGLEIKHVNTALRWKKQGIDSLGLRILGGILQAVWDISCIGMIIVFFRPNVLHLTTSAAFASLKDAVLMLFARLFGVVGLIHYHTSYLTSQNPNGWQIRTARLAMTMAGGVIVLDPKTHDFIKSFLPPHKLHKIPNMIDLKGIDDLGKNNQVNIIPQSSSIVHCLFVGRVVSEKGIVELVEACNHIPEVQLHLVGPVAVKFQEHLLQIAKGRGNGEWLHFYGQVDNVEARGHITRSDIVILPSYYEAFPNVVLESMAFGKPVIASDVGAISEIIDAFGKKPLRSMR